MSIIRYWALRFGNSFIQRTLANPTTTFGVGTVGGIVATVVAAVGAPGCPHYTINYVEIFAAVQAGGALLTDGNKALVHHADGQVSTVPVDPGIGDERHTRQGGNSF
jgi:hypothetical protein